jgi:hypothetical protein
MLPGDGGWQQEHVGGIKKLYFYVYCTCVLWFKYDLIAPDEYGAWGSVVGRSWDRFPVVSLDFSVTYFLPTVPWPWGRLSPS